MFNSNSIWDHRFVSRKTVKKTLNKVGFFSVQVTLRYLYSSSIKQYDNTPFFQSIELNYRYLACEQALIRAIVMFERGEGVGREMRNFSSHSLALELLAG